MRISLDKLVGMKPQAICSNKDLVREFAKVRKELLNKKFNVLTFENTTDKSSRLWYQDRRIVSYNAIDDTAHVVFDDGYEGDFPSDILNINRLVVIKSIAEYMLSVA